MNRRRAWILGLGGGLGLLGCGGDDGSGFGGQAAVCGETAVQTVEAACGGAGESGCFLAVETGLEGALARPSLLDVDDDGVLDLAADLEGGGVVVGFGNGDGSFALETLEPGGGFEAAGDLDGDGRAEILRTVAGGALEVAWQPSPRSFSEFEATGLVTGVVEVADFDGQGGLEVVGWMGETLQLVTATAATPFEATLVDAPLRSLASEMYVGDFDGDGRGDLALAGPGTVVFGDDMTMIPVEPLGAPITGTGDLDGDGRDDVFIGNMVFAGSSDRSLTPSGAATVVGCAQATAVIADLDDDGDGDGVVAAEVAGAQRLVILANDGAGQIEHVDVLGTGDALHAARVGDLDGDGRLDVLAVHADRVTAYLAR